MAKTHVPHFLCTPFFFLLKDIWINNYINQTSSKCKFLFSRNTIFCEDRFSTMTTQVAILYIKNSKHGLVSFFILV